MLFKFYKVPITLKILFINVAINMILIIFFLVANYVQSYKSLEKQLGFTLKHIALTASSIVEEEKHSQISSSGDEKKKPEFRELKLIMEDIRKKNELTPETFYTFKVNPDKSLSFAIMLHKNTFCWRHIYSTRSK